MSFLSVALCPSMGSSGKVPSGATERLSAPVRYSRVNPSHETTKKVLPYMVTVLPTEMSAGPKTPPSLSLGTTWRLRKTPWGMPLLGCLGSSTCTDSSSRYM